MSKHGYIIWIHSHNCGDWDRLLWGFCPNIEIANKEKIKAEKHYRPCKIRAIIQTCSILGDE